MAALPSLSRWQAVIAGAIALGAAFLTPHQRELGAQVAGVVLTVAGVVAAAFSHPPQSPVHDQRDVESGPTRQGGGF